MSTAIIIQARMGSTRLPGKHLKKVLERPLISFLFERLKRVKKANQMILATTSNHLDDCLVNYAQQEKIDYFRGSEENVLERYFQAAKKYEVGTIVRISADCPLIDPAIVDETIDYFFNSSFDYASNTLVRKYPRGMDTEVFSFPALKKAHEEAKEPKEQEHVTPFFYLHPELFRIGSLENKEDQSFYRLTVDEEEDFTLVKKIIETLYPLNPEFNLGDIIGLLKKNPEWPAINARVKQKTLEE